jgi:hypothetical protein
MGGYVEKEMMLQPECYARHANIDNHISEGKFWRGAIITIGIAFGGIMIGQYNMSIENNNKMIALNSKLTTMVEVNTLRLNRLENFYFKNERTP